MSGMRRDLVGFAQAMLIGRTFYLLLSFAFIEMLIIRGARAVVPGPSPCAELTGPRLI
jgi:hypothetical protein